MSDHKAGPFMHDFQAVCKQGHKRNFVWGDEYEAPMTKVSSRCVHCGGMQEFVVLNYWQQPIREKYFKIRK